MLISGLRLPVLDEKIRKIFDDAVFSCGESLCGFDIHLERSAQRILSTYLRECKDCNCCDVGHGPPSGFGMVLSLHLVFDYKLRVRAHAGFGYSPPSRSVFQPVGTVHFNLMNDGIGTGSGKRLEYSISAGAYLNIGGGEQRNGLSTYTMHADALSPIADRFKNSFRFGQYFSYSSAAQHGKSFSLSQIQRAGHVGFRIGNIVNISSGNDTGMLPYWGGGGDRWYSGFLTVHFPLAYFMIGHQIFTGTGKIMRYEGAEEKEYKAPVKRQPGDPIYYEQSKKERALNKATTFIRYLYPGNEHNIDFFGDSWLQRGIHKAILNPYFHYDFFKIQR